MLSSINDLEVIPSLSDKAKLFAVNLGFNSKLDENNIPYLYFLSLLSRSFVMSVSGFLDMKSLDSSKARSSDKIPVVVLRSLSLELSPILRSFLVAVN